MFNKIKKIFRTNNTKQSKENEWVFKKPIDNTLGNNNILPYPTVSQPTLTQIENNDVPAFPSYIAIEVTNVCNLKCTHCNYRYGLDHYTRDRGFINRDLMEKTLDEVRQYGVNVLMNYDGEPLIHKKFIDYLKLATQKGINTYFNTNGTLFNKAFTDKLVEFYRGSVFFSIDGNKEWFESIRVPANYDTVVKNLKHLIQANEANGWPITIGVSLCNFGQTNQERKAFLEEWLPIVNYVSMGEVNDKFGTMISNPMTQVKFKKRPICVVPWQTCGICYNGDVIPCSIYVTRANVANAILGNLQNQTIKEVWNGKAFNNFREMIAQEKYKESFCDKCERWLSQFSFPDLIEGNIKTVRNAYWTTYHNLEKGKLNFKG